MYDPALKDKLIEELWLPSALELGAFLFPRKKNKRLKLLTLTSDKGFQEISRFEESRLTTGELTTAWAESFRKKWWLETEISPPVKVLGAMRYERSLLGQRSDTGLDFPFHILNLDFWSQDPDLGEGRIEKEIQSLKETVSLQQSAGGNFVLIYTTLVNSYPLSHAEVARAVGHMPGSALGGQSFPARVETREQKEECLKAAILEAFSVPYPRVAVKIIHLTDGDDLLSIAAKPWRQEGGT